MNKLTSKCCYCARTTLIKFINLYVTVNLVRNESWWDGVVIWFDDELYGSTPWLAVGFKKYEGRLVILLMSWWWLLGVIVLLSSSLRIIFRLVLGAMSWRLLVEQAFTMNIVVIIVTIIIYFFINVISVSNNNNDIIINQGGWKGRGEMISSWYIKTRRWSYLIHISIIAKKDWVDRKMLRKIIY